MMHDYIRNNRESILPSVKDWTDAQEDIRYQRRRLTWQEWFYVTHGGFNLMTYGPSTTNLISMAILLYFFRNGFIIFIASVITLFSVIDLYRKIKQYRRFKELTLYDLHMRD